MWTISELFIDGVQISLNFNILRSIKIAKCRQVPLPSYFICNLSKAGERKSIRERKSSFFLFSVETAWGSLDVILRVSKNKSSFMWTFKFILLGWETPWFWHHKVPLHFHHVNSSQWKRKGTVHCISWCFHLSGLSTNTTKQRRDPKSLQNTRKLKLWINHFPEFVLFMKLKGQGGRSTVKTRSKESRNLLKTFYTQVPPWHNT